MPVYTYRCENCGVQFDEAQKFTDDPLVKCPECGKKSLRKVFQPVGIVFKGSGFYATDHKSSSGLAVPGNTKTGKDTGGKDAGSTSGESAGKADAPSSSTTEPVKKEAAPASGE